MKKRLIALLLALAIMLGLIPAVMAEDDSIPASAGYYYVYTENGKGLNVRESPGGKVVGSLKYGTKIYCYYRDGGNGWAAFISSRYLRKSKPPAKPASGSSSSSSSSAAASVDPAAEINAEFRSAKRVEPFSVTVRPSRASGWVNLRWAPSKSAEIMATYKQNDKLLVIRELANWYQVEDQDTGDVGFISKQFVAQ